MRLKQGFSAARDQRDDDTNATAANNLQNPADRNFHQHCRRALVPLSGLRSAQDRIGANGVRRKTVKSIVIAIALVGAALGAARAQSPTPQLPSITTVPANTLIASNYAAFDLGTNFLYNSSGQGGPGGLAHMFGTPNPNGGGASDTSVSPRFRAWTEGYDLAARNQAVGNIAGDSRHSDGGVVGFGMQVAPGITLNTSLDQSHTNINVMGQPQHAGYDLTQVGVSGAIESGAWIFSAALVHGVASIGSSRDTPGGTATANYDGSVWGSLADVSYYISLGRFRIVPRAGTDWLRSRTDPYSEAGGFLPATVPGLTISRTRIFAGGEIGNFWMIDKTMIDVMAYGRLVDVVSFNAPPLIIAAATGAATAQPIQPPTESRLGYETGAQASLKFSPLARLYVAYDGRFRGGYQSQGGSVGVEFRW
jgi:Autotransporter beta-domain